MDQESIDWEHIRQRFVEEWERSNCASVPYAPIAKEKFRPDQGLEALAALASCVPDFDAHYVLTGERMTYRLPENVQQVLNKILLLSEENRFLVERYMDGMLRSN